MKRKIAMFANTWVVDYTSSLLDSIQSTINEYDLEVHIFNTYDVTEKVDLIPKEHDILWLPDLEDYDSMLVIFNTVGQYPEVEKLVKQFAATGKPVLCIDQAYAGQPYMGVDNYRSFYSIVEHMITKHNCRILNYIGGPANHPENLLRLKAFKDCLAAHGITPDPERIVSGHFLTVDGKNAYNYWKVKELHLPDAVICASDNMALGYCITSEADGYHAPADYLISGFDNISEAQSFTPSITSVNRSWETLGRESILQLVKLMDGEAPQNYYPIESTLMCNESCGCVSTKDTSNTIRINYSSKKERESLGTWSRKALQLFCSSDDLSMFREGMIIAENQIGFPNLTLCLNHNDTSEADNGLPKSEFTTTDAYTDTLFTIAAEEAGYVSRKKLIPDKLKEDGANLFVFSPLHFGKHNFGYCVLPYAKNMLQYDKHRKFVDYICLSLECVSQRELLRETNHKLETLYLTDQLTGIYNRFGLTNIAPDYFRSQYGRVSIFYIDLDNLKTINDQHGHAMGDKSLIAMSQAIKEVFPRAALHIRMGGDEFLVVHKLLTEEAALQKEQQLQQYLTDYSTRENMPLTLTASIGHVLNDTADADLEILVREADSKMYAIKQAKKKVGK